MCHTKICSFKGFLEVRLGTDMHQQILQEPGKERVGSKKDQVTGFLAPEEPAFQVSQQTHNPGRGS